MKTKILTTLLSLCAILFIVAGCQSTPTRLEREVFDIKTNTIVQEVIVLHTNVVEKVIEVPVTKWMDAMHTNVIEVIELRTNKTLVTEWQTNQVAKETYDLTPNKKSGEIGTVAALIASPWGLSGVVGTIFTGFLTMWGKMRSSGNKISGTLAQGIEVAKAVMTPEQNAAYTQWLRDHQKEMGVIVQVGKLLSTSKIVSSSDAKETAGLIADALTPIGGEAASRPVGA